MTPIPLNEQHLQELIWRCVSPFMRVASKNEKGLLVFKRDRPQAGFTFSGDPFRGS